MDIFNSRISLEEASTIVQSALQRELLGPKPSIIIHHLELMRSRIAALQTAFPESTAHTVAIKANPVLEILREVVQAGAGLEAASIEEVQLALAAGCPCERVVFDSPAKTIEEICQALRLGVYLNADSFDELDRIAATLKSANSKSIVGLRINTLVGGGTIEHTSVSAADSKFGVPLSSNPRRIIEAFAEHPWLCGLHVHVGSQGCRVELLVQAAQRVAALRREIMTAIGKSVSYIDLGGGLPTVYRTGDVAPSPAAYSGFLQQQSPELFSADVRLITEFGRAIQANCGLAVSRVEYIKPAQQMAVIHLGADFLLRPIYRPEDWQHEFFVLDSKGRPKAGTAAPITITGPLCFAGDIVARDVLLPNIEEGDWIVIRDVGAYTLSMWSRHCSRGIPAVIGYDSQRSNSLRVLRPADIPSDVVRFWSSSP
jgi:diaminopimelate decarboxylase